MAGPDPKRMYLAVNSQNIETLKALKPYWSKPFVSVTPSGSGTKYTALQAAMVLQKMKVVDFLLEQPSVDMGVKNTEGKSTLIIAVESKMTVEVLGKILEKFELRCLNEVDSAGYGAIDYSDPSSDVFEFLHSMGCKTKREKEVVMAGFFEENITGTIPGVSAQQRRRKAGSTPRSKKEQKTETPASSRSLAESSNSPHSCSESKNACRETDDQQDKLWGLFDNIEDLEAALKAYVDEWGVDHEEGENCAHWLRSLNKAKAAGKEEKLLKKWNASVDQQGIIGEKGDNSNPKMGRYASACSVGNESNRSRGLSSAVDKEAVKLFFAGKAEDQVNIKRKGKPSHRLTFVVARRSSSAGPSSVGKR